MTYFDLDLIAVGDDLARSVPDVEAIRLFGSRKYPGKTRSDLDLLVTGPPNLEALLQFRSSNQFYQPLDLWLVLGDSAVSAVTGSTLPVSSLSTIPLFPLPDTQELGTIRTQKFRTDIDYKMSVVPPSSVPSRQEDALGVKHRIPALLDPSLEVASTAIVELLEGAVKALVRMREDGNAKRGKGTQLTLLTEYDFQNLAELTLAPIIPMQREAYVVRSGGKDRTVDFSVGAGRIALELKFAKTSSELNSQLKAAQGILKTYLEHPGVEIAIAVIAIVEGFKVDYNAISSWCEVGSYGRRAFIKTIKVPKTIGGQ